MNAFLQIVQGKKHVFQCEYLNTFCSSSSLSLQNLSKEKKEKKRN